MSAVILPILYPMVTPFIAYYTLKYAAGMAVDVAIDKTKNAMWYVVTYPFSRKTEPECVKCRCEKCRMENCEKEECIQGLSMGYEILDLTNVKEKVD